MEKSGVEKKAVDKKKFLFVSEEALIGDLAWQVKQEGHDVKYFIGEKAQKDVCDGFVEKIDDWKQFKDWADVIVFDDVFFGEAADKLRKEGKAVIGGSAYTDKLEEDREFGQAELKKVGVNVLPHWDFEDFDQAIDFVKKNPGRYVLKPTSKTGEKELLYVGQEEDGKDVLQVLELYKKAWSKKITGFQLQKYASGVEVAVGAFFNGVDFISPINVNFEHKRMFPGDIGPSTGEMGTSCYWAPSNRIFNETLVKVLPMLRESGYVGYVDLNCIVNNKGIHPLEFTTRFGYPTISLHIEGVTSQWGEFLHALANKKPFDLKTKKGFQVCVVVAVPPFPFYDIAAFKKYSEDATIMFRKKIDDGLHLGDVKLVEGDWRLAGYSGYALVVTGSGPTMDDARKQVYQRVRNIMIPNMFYRTDIGVRWFTDSDRLHTWGYLS
ncbi:phosphoribosylamine--glycine ligase [Candidatus Woesearchaeota archaeon]|nr:phosphoribosylamine--glycine ligase [Candidatus Woesearchaeota archaeon]